MEGVKRERRCVFCASTKRLSLEHIVPQWIWRTFGDANESLRVTNDPWGYMERRIGVDGSTDLQVFEPDNSRPAIHPAARKVRMVCAACNNGWMADLEGEVKRIVTVLIESRIWRLSAEELRTLRRWLMKTGLMFEREDRRAPMASPGAYRAIWQDEEPPGSWYCGLARVRDEAQVFAGSTPLAVQALKEDEGEPAATRIYANQHVMTFGGLMFIIRHSDLEIRGHVRLDHDLYRHRAGRFVGIDPTPGPVAIASRKVARLHPESVEDIVWEWGHPTRSEDAFTLLGDGDGTCWIGPMNTATASEILRPLGIDPTWTGTEDESVSFREYVRDDRFPMILRPARRKRLRRRGEPAP